MNSILYYQADPELPLLQDINIPIPWLSTQLEGGLHQYASQVAKSAVNLQENSVLIEWLKCIGIFRDAHL